MVDQINYLARDFTSLRNELINKVKEKNAWQDFYESGLGVTLIELFSYVGDLMTFYVNRGANEGHLPTALDRNSIINLSKLVGYAWPKPSSSSSKVRFWMDSTKNENVTIDAYTRIRSTGGHELITENQVTITPGTFDATVNIIQGIRTYREAVGVSTGLKNQAFDLTYSDIAGNSGWLVCEVGPGYTPYAVVDSFAGYESTSAISVIAYRDEDTLQLHFGDNLLGLIPPSGQNIYLTYLRTVGGLSFGGVGIVNSVVDQIYTDISLTEVTDINVTNLEPVSGGADMQSRDDARTNIPLWVRSLDRMVTRSDYTSLLRIVSGVYDVQVLDVNDQSGAEVIPFRFAKVYVRVENDGTMTSLIEQAVGDQIEQKALIGTLYEINQVHYHPVNVNVTIYRSAGYNLVQATQNLTSQLNTWFANRANTPIGGDILVQNLITSLNNVTGVATYQLGAPTVNIPINDGTCASLGQLTIVDGGTI